MALVELQQATSLIKRATHIIILVPEKTSLDAFASMTALYVALLDQHAETVDAISPSHVPPTLQFLPGSSQTSMKPQLKPDVVLDIAGPEKALGIRQEPLQGGVRIHITFDESVDISKDQLETLVRPLPYDLAIIIGAADLEELGETFTDHTDFFYNTPIINIDHRAKNEHFGTVNLVDITASSAAEVTYGLINELPDTPVTADMATALYAGIVAATNSFQKPSTSPQSFHIAAELMEADADKESVIQNVVKTKPLNLLKLLGRTYARLRFEDGGQLYWSILRPVDFQASGATADTIPDAMYELTNSIAGFNAAFIMSEQTDGTYEIYLTIGKGLNSRRQEIQEQLSAKRQNGALTFSLTADSIEKAEELALEKVRGILP